MNYLNFFNPFEKVSHPKLLEKLSSHDRSEELVGEEKMCQLEWLNYLLKYKKQLRFLNSQERSTVIEVCAVR